MTDQENENIEELDNVEELETEVAETEEAIDENSDQRIEELEAKKADYKDKMMRALAEAQNTRTRADKARQDISKFAVSGFAKDMLTVADNLRRALDAVTEDQVANNPELKNVLDGVNATERELLRLLTGHGVKKIEELEGKLFDPNFHEVMFETPIPGQASGTIIQVLEPGYMIHDRLLRPARVGVAKNDGDAGLEEGGILDEEV